MNIVPLRTTANIIARLMFPTAEDDEITAAFTVDGRFDIVIDVYRTRRNRCRLWMTHTPHDSAHFRHHNFNVEVRRGRRALANAMERGLIDMIENSRLQAARSALWLRFEESRRNLSYDQETVLHQISLYDEARTKHSRFFQEMDWAAIDFWNQWLNDHLTI